MPNSKRSQGSIRAVAEALFHDGEHAPAPAELDALEVDMTDFLEQGGAWPRLVIGASLLVVTVLVPLMLRKLGGFARLPVAERIEGLQRLEESALGLPLLAVKAALCIVYYESPVGVARLGFDQQCMSGRVRT